MKVKGLQVDLGQSLSNKLDCAIELSEGYETRSESVEEIENTGVSFARAGEWTAVGKIH